MTGIRSLHDATTVGHSDLFVIRGFEDWRLFEHGGHEYAVASMLSANHEGRSQQFLLRLDGDTVVDATPLSRPTDGHQKNWMPVIGSDPMMFVDRCSPLRLRTFDTRTGECSVVDPGVVIPIAAPFRGGSQLVPWGDGYLAVVHEVAGDHTGRRTYLHRFVAFDQDCCPTACTDQFWIVRRGVEFCAGLRAVSPDSLVISFGSDDRSAWLASVAPDDVAAALRPIADRTRADRAAERRAGPTAATRTAIGDRRRDPLARGP